MLYAIREAFKQLVADELKYRKQIEGKLKQYYIKLGEEDPEAKMLEHISYMEDRDNVEEDAHQCKYCTDLCYLSMAQC